MRTLEQIVERARALYWGMNPYDEDAGSHRRRAASQAVAEAGKSSFAHKTWVLAGWLSQSSCRWL